MVELGILGPVEARRDGALVAISAAKERALLAALSIRPKESVSRERLVEDLWGADPPDSAEHALEVYVSKLRRALGHELVQTQGRAYMLDVDPETIDAVRFQRLVQQGRSELANDPDAAARTLREALALWRGPALADVMYEDFAQREIGRLEELRLTAREERIEADLRLGRHAEVLPELEAAAQEHPLRERLRGQLMLALYRSGRQADALDAFRLARATLLEELGLEPSANLRELQSAILRQDASLDVEPAELLARRHLPAFATPFLGRRQELADVAARLRDGQARLVTLVGPGGSGKTRLAVQAAHELAADYGDGVYFVDLAPVADAALFEESLGAALDLGDAPAREFLGSRQLLLVLDNFEHIDTAAPVVAALLKAAPGVSALVTSRSPLRLYGEHVFRVPPLADDDAAHLFVSRALAAGRELEPADAVRQLCAWLDRLPLAIELVAARAREMSPAQILAALPARLDVAARGPRDAPLRQQTLRAAIDWSYELLRSPEQTLLARVGVFAGGFTPEAAAVVCGAELSTLAALVAASLVVEPETPSGESRLALLDTVREFALERLGATPDATCVRAKHADFFLRLAERAAPELEGDAEDSLQRLELEHENLRSAIDWFAAERRFVDELRTVVALRRFWLVRGYTQEAQRRIEDALARDAHQPPRLRATAAGAAAVFALQRHDSQRARRWTEQSLDVFRSLDDRAGIALSLNRLGDVAKAEERPEDAARYYTLARDVARALEDKRPLAAVLTNGGSFALQRGDIREAQELTREALGTWEELGHTEGVAIAAYNLAVASIEEGSLQDALPYLEQSFELARRLGFSAQLGLALIACAVAAARHGAPDRAAFLTAAAERLLTTGDVRLTPLHRRWCDEIANAIAVGLTRTQRDEQSEAGRTTSTDDAVEYGLDAVRSVAGRSTRRSAATPDETNRARP